MSDEQERRELHRRVILLKKSLEAGTFHVAEHLADDFERDLLSVRMAEDGLVDPRTVTSRIRATLNLLAHIDYRDEIKAEVSLQEIQAAYISLIESLFGDLYNFFLTTDATPWRFSRWFASQEIHVSENDGLATEFLDQVQDFWESLGEAVWIHAEDQHAQRAVFGGEPFPSGDPAAGLGLYFDTVVLPDPFLRMIQVLRLEEPEGRVRMVVRWAIEVLRLRDLILADLDPPFLLILPDRTHVEEDYREFLTASAEGDALLHLKRVTGKEFSSMEEANGFLSTLRSPEEVASIIEDQSGILFSTDWTDPLEEQLERHYEGWMARYGIEMSLGQSLLSHFHSRMIQATDLLRRSTSLRGSPIIHAPTSWKWLEWQLQARSHLHPEADKGKLHIAKALGTREHPDLIWVGDIPPEAMIEIRRQNALPELREQLGRGITELTNAAPQDFESDANRVVENLREALEQHRRNISNLRKSNLKFAGKDIASFLVTGTIEVAAAAAGTPLFGVLSVIAGRSGVVPTFKDLKEKSDELLEERHRIERSALGILSNYVKLPKT